MKFDDRNKPVYTQTYSNFWLQCYNEDFHQRYGGWYSISCHATGHAAFSTEETLKQWAELLNLTIDGTLPEQGIPAVLKITGTYHVASHLCTIGFKAVTPLIKIAHMDNGNYTLGKITQDEQGVRTIHHLNCNIHERIIFPYADIRDHKEGIQQLIEQSPDTRPLLAEQTIIRVTASTNPTEYGLLGTIVNVDPNDDLGEVYGIYLKGDYPGNITRYAADEVEPIE